MTGPLRLVIFDVDGTLVDSQNAIVAAMASAFGGLDLPVPDRRAILSIVGLSLDHAMRRLAPHLPAADLGRLVDGYKASFRADRQQAAVPAPLFPNVLETLDEVSRSPDLLLGIATGKSRRGLRHLLAEHGLESHFVTTQTADDHPSKPHPAMLHAAMAEAGTGTAETVMIGDTSFDMDMARAAGVTGIGVSWGYHAAGDLGADHVLDGFDALPGLLDRLWKR